MIVLLPVLIPLAGGLVAAYAAKTGGNSPRWISLFSMAGVQAVTFLFWLSGPPPGQVWYGEVNAGWIGDLGIRFHLAMDGISLLLVALTAFLGMAAVLASWSEVTERTGFFHFNLLWCLGGIAGVFLSRDLFLFYVFWEIMLIPMYFLISIWGHEDRMRAAVKFFIFTQLSGLLMLASILGLYFLHENSAGFFSFDLADLMGLSLSPGAAAWLMTGFLAAFLVKLPAIGLHTWLPDAHTQAPTAGSVILAGLLLKTGAYGLLRFAVPLFPEALPTVAPVMTVLGAAGILYGAVLAFAQTDIKRLVAYTSISHMGFVLLGIFVNNELALTGALIQIICHALSTGALFMLAGALAERLNTRQVDRMGGFWRPAPRMGTVMMIFTLASLGLPGLGNFVGEFLVLLGTYRVSPVLASAAALGFVVSAVYALMLMQRVFFGRLPGIPAIPDLTPRETLATAAMAAVLLVIGLYPRPVLDTAKPAVSALLASSQTGDTGTITAGVPGSGDEHAGR
ncbi:MAG: NADH-quinone oxidoreductase subunit M [Pseudomonadota bacterium]|jgi:NADH-quinone oxidoreductase subunit M